MQARCQLSLPSAGLGHDAEEPPDPAGDGDQAGSEPGLWTLAHGDGDDAIEGDHWSGRAAAEQLVQTKDLTPVGVLVTGRLVVNRGDRGLELVRTDRRAGERLRDQRDPLSDRGR